MKRTKMVMVRLTEPESAALSLAAELAGRTLAGEIRWRALRTVTIEEEAPRSRTKPKIEPATISQAEGYIEAIKDLGALQRSAPTSKIKPMPDGLSTSERMRWLRENC